MYIKLLNSIKKHGIKSTFFILLLTNRVTLNQNFTPYTFTFYDTNILERMKNAYVDFGIYA